MKEYTLASAEVLELRNDPVCKDRLQVLGHGDPTSCVFKFDDTFHLWEGIKYGFFTDTRVRITSLGALPNTTEFRGIWVNDLERTIKRYRKTLPPARAEYLFYFFLDPKDSDALVGDLEERYKLILQKFGKFKADFWYWSQALRSTGPIALQWFKKLVMKPVMWLFSSLVAHGLLKDGSVMEFVRGLLAELTKRMRG